jgi:hypothetical protein
MGLTRYRSAGALLALAAAALAAVAMLVAAAPALAQNAATSKFDHDPTGFPLTGTHVSVPCASCHINGRFKTTPKNCFGCHNGMTAPGAASLLGAHPITTNYCEGCHQTTTWRDYRFIDHVQALGPCSKCHNNKVAVGKTRQHPVTTAECNICHFNTVTFKGGILATTTPATPAASAKSAAAATPAPSGSPSTLPNPRTSSPQTPNPQASTSAPASSGPQTSVSMRNGSGKPDHTTFVSGCARCHNGASATGKPAKHIATAAPCESCHKSTRTFAGARVDHASLSGACATCHNGVTAEGRPRQHLMTAAPCDACHRTTLWTPATFRHISPAFVNHGPAVGCESCHVGNAQTVAWKFPGFKPGCAGCHAQQYRPMAHVKFQRPMKVYYTVSELRDCTGSCHTYADSTMRTIVTRNFSRHRAMGGGW